MTFSLHEGWVVMSSQITYTHDHQHTPLSPYTWHLCLDIQYLRHFYNLSQPHRVTASHLTLGDNHRVDSVIERSLREIIGSKNFALINLSLNFCDKTIYDKVFLENLVAVH